MNDGRLIANIIVNNLMPDLLCVSTFGLEMMHLKASIQRNNIFHGESGTFVKLTPRLSAAGLFPVNSLTPPL